MNEASPAKPRRSPFKRIAAATATAVGAALLTTPGTAAAQSEVDCDALGDDPLAYNMAGAFDSAVACGVEVRIAHHSEPYSTLYVTPTGQLHVAATADPTGWFYEDETVDPTLMAFDGALVQTASPWLFWLYGTDTSQPLFNSRGGTLEWTGEKPIPSYTGTTAAYDELAEGLDLSIEMDVASAELRFTVDSAEAWQTLATGLILEGADTAVVEDDALHMYPESSHDDVEVHTTPFAALDAAGDFNAVGLELGGDDALALSLPDGALDTVAFPLTVTTQWAYSGYGIGEWGVVSSAAPDLAAYRGDGAGTDASFLEYSGENGDAVVGAYCDRFGANPDCATTSDAASYWSFNSTLETDDLSKPSIREWSFPIDRATFSIDLAADENGMFTCRTPDLVPVADYGTTVTWNNQPDAVGDAVAAQCEDEVVMYDVTDPVSTAWADTTVASKVAFGMTESAETARFHGGSARLDVYFDIVGLSYGAPSRDDCGSHEISTVLFGSTVFYGGFYASIWHREDLSTGFTWSASFIDAVSGETALTTEPLAITANSADRTALEPGTLADGYYRVVYTITADSGRFEYRSDPCYIGVDTSKPEILDYEIEPGQHYVGQPLTIEVDVADAGFPDGVNSLKVGCATGNSEPARDEVLLTDSATAVCEITPPTTDPWLSFWMWDEVGNYDTMDTPGLLATHSRNDFNGDGHQDLMAVRKSDGNMVFHAGKGDGTFAAGVAKGAGWGDIDAVMAGDLNGDGRADLLGRDNKTGYLHLYPGNGAGGWGARVKIGSGWNSMGVFTGSGDFNLDGKSDLLAVKKSDGALYLYPGKGDGTFGTASFVRSQFTSNWRAFDSITAPGDVNGDGYDDFLVHDSTTGAYSLYFNNGTGQFQSRATVPASLDGTGADRYRQVTGVGDVDGDNHEDLLAVDSRTGELELHSLAANGTALHGGRTVASGWGTNRLPAPVADRAVDFNGDNANDVIVRMSSNATTYLYPGNGTGGFGARSTIGTGFSGMNVMETAGDMTGDGFADLLARETSTGDLYVYPGNGKGAFTAARVKVGSGWNAFNMIAGGYDYNGDGKADILARETSTGTLWLYPGTGNGTVGARVKAASGWGAFRETEAVGDFDHDGKADVIAIKTADECMYLYRGNGNGTFKTAVNLGCGWSTRSALTAVGDFDRDGHVDWLARRKSDGAMFLYSGNGSNGYTGRQIATGWNVFNQIA